LDRSPKFVVSSTAVLRTSRRLFAIITLVLMLSAASFALGQNAVASKPEPPMADLAPSTIPSDSNYQAHLDWNRQCESRVLAVAHKRVDIMFIGDSITQNWTSADWGDEFRGRLVWAENYAAKFALNFGVGADKTQNVLWRMDTMGIKDLHPKVIVLLIGVNNYQYSPQQIADGTKTILTKVQTFYPGSKTILVSILPNRLAYETTIKANALTRSFADGKNVFYLDLFSLFVPDGDNWVGMGADHLHPNEVGYRLWADAMRPLLTRLLAEANASNSGPGQPNETAANPALTPSERLSEPWWSKRHETILEQVHSHPDSELVLIGDSITNNYDKPNPPDENFQPTWKNYYEPRHALNLGFSGDTTANVLWRLQHGEVKGLQPKVAMLLIGTNNTGWKDQTAEQTEAGIDAVVSELRKDLPSAQILLLGILPSEQEGNILQRNLDVNAYLSSKYVGVKDMTYLDLSPIFSSDGVLDESIFYDPRLTPKRNALHPDTIGQCRMAAAIEPVLARLLKEPPRPSICDSLHDAIR
jgi:lysophospholipase L1-like esterase